MKLYTWEHNYTWGDNNEHAETNYAAINVEYIIGVEMLRYDHLDNEQSYMLSIQTKERCYHRYFRCRDDAMRELKCVCEMIRSIE